MQGSPFNDLLDQLIYAYNDRITFEMLSEAEQLNLLSRAIIDPEFDTYDIFFNGSFEFEFEVNTLIIGEIRPEKFKEKVIERLGYDLRDKINTRIDERYESLGYNQPLKWGEERWEEPW